MCSAEATWRSAECLAIMDPRTERFPILGGMAASDCDFDTHVNLTEAPKGTPQGDRSACLDWVLGIDDEGAEIRMALNSESPHLLIAGASKSGKNTVLNSFLLQMMHLNAPTQIKFWGLDPKNELQQYTGIAHIGALEDSKSMQAKGGPCIAAAQFFDSVASELGRRLSSSPEHGGVHRLPRIVVVVEECSSFFAVPPSQSTDETQDAYSSLMADAERIACHGAQAGIHLVLTTQDPGIVPPVVQRYCQVVGLYVPDLISSMNLIGRSGLEQFPHRAGRFIADDKQTWQVEGRPFRIGEGSLREHLHRLPRAT